MTALIDATLPRWATMWLLAGGLFAAGKVATWRKAGREAAWQQTAGYFLLWLKAQF